MNVGINCDGVQLTSSIVVAFNKLADYERN